MAEEAEQLVEEQENIEEREPQETEETPEEEVEETPEEEEKGEEQEEEKGEYYESEEDYAEKELGVGRKTFSQLASEYKEMQEQLGAYKAEPPKFSPLRPLPEQKTQDEFKFLPERGLATKYVSTIRFDESTDAGQKMKASYGSVAQLVDSALDPVLENTEKGLQNVRAAMSAFMDFAQQLSYKGVKRKDLVPFEKLQPFMMQQGLLDAERAAQIFIAQNNPTLLPELIKSAKNEGRKRGLKEKWKKASSVRRTKERAPRAPDWKPYFDRDGGRNAKFYSLPPDKQVAMAEARLKAVEAEYDER